MIMKCSGGLFDQRKSFKPCFKTRSLPNIFPIAKTRHAVSSNSFITYVLAVERSCTTVITAKLWCHKQSLSITKRNTTYYLKMICSLFHQSHITFSVLTIQIVQHFLACLGFLVLIYHFHYFPSKKTLRH